MTRNISLDAYRGFSLVSMLFFHGYYDLVFVFGWMRDLLPPTIYFIWQQTIVLSFIFIAGAATCYSSKLLRRGLELELWGMAITLITYVFLPSELIVFGVLSFMGTAMLLLTPFQRAWSRASREQLLALAAVAFGAFCCTQGLPSGYLGLYGCKLYTLTTAFKGILSFIIGLPTKGIISADYVPVLPHLFIFIMGRALWQYGILSKKTPQLAADKGLTPYLAVLGRHSLSFYLLHQIVLYLFLQIIGLFL